MVRTRNTSIEIKKYIISCIATNLNVLLWGGKKGFHEYVQHDPNTAISYTNIARLSRSIDGSWLSIPRLFRLYAASVAYLNGLQYHEIQFMSKEQYEGVNSLSAAKRMVREIDIDITKEV